MKIGIPFVVPLFMQVPEMKLHGNRAVLRIDSESHSPEFWTNVKVKVKVILRRETLMHILLEEACFASHALPADANINYLVVRGKAVKAPNEAWGVAGAAGPPEREGPAGPGRPRSPAFVAADLRKAAAAAESSGRSRGTREPFAALHGWRQQVEARTL